jgi:hypothetical protein
VGARDAFDLQPELREPLLIAFRQVTARLHTSITGCSKLAGHIRIGFNQLVHQKERHLFAFF